MLPSADAPSTSGVSLYFACRRGGLALWEHDCCLLGWQLEQLLLVVLGWPDDFGRNANAMRLEPYTRVWCGDVWSWPFGYYFLYTCALCLRAVLTAEFSRRNVGWQWHIQWQSTLLPTTMIEATTYLSSGKIPEERRCTVERALQAQRLNQPVAEDLPRNLGDGEYMI